MTPARLKERRKTHEESSAATPTTCLFRPITIRSVTSRNRIMLSPMCQYSANDGRMTDWHFAHLAARAVGGAGIVFTEAVHTEPRGRITHYCLGLWNDEQRDRMKRVVEFIAEQGAVPAIQLGHAGRKGSAMRPWEGSRPLASSDGGWLTIGASNRPYAEALALSGQDVLGDGHSAGHRRLRTIDSPRARSGLRDP